MMSLLCWRHWKWIVDSDHKLGQGLWWTMSLAINVQNFLQEHNYFKAKPFFQSSRKWDFMATWSYFVLMWSQGFSPVSWILLCQTNLSLQKDVLIHLVCSAKGGRRETTRLLCWWNLSPWWSETPSCMPWLFCFPFICNRWGWGKACCDLHWKLVGGFLLWKSKDMDFISVQSRKVLELQTPLSRTSTGSAGQKFLFSALVSLWVCLAQFSYVVRCGLGTAMPMWRLWGESEDCVYPESQ